MIHRKDLIGRLANHPVAANLLLLMMLLAGAFALKQLNVQFFPDFELEIVRVNTAWRGASAEDVEAGITTPLEQRLRGIDRLVEMTSTSTAGRSAITLEFREGSDMLEALDRVKQQVSEFGNLPGDAEAPAVVHATRYDPLARLLIRGPTDPGELRRLAHRFEGELLKAGIDRIAIVGLPNEEIVIELDPIALRSLQSDLAAIGARIGRQSLDLPAGLVGEADVARELRSLDQRRTPSGFAGLVAAGTGATRINLGDVARITRADEARQRSITVDGEPAVVLVLQRSVEGHSLKAARILHDWLDATRPTLPPTVQIEVFAETWELILDRIMVLVKNGGGGLVLVLVMLYLFLSSRVAFWVAAGIPASFMATLAVLLAIGGSINMVSLFALIMALGIIVDDAIVVGEDAQAHYDAGDDPLKAAEGGARRMLSPVLASSLTTIAAFLPLLLIGGRIGNVLGVIPVVVICVILASLVEAFLILPGHLRFAFHRGHHVRRPLRQRLDRGFEHFRERLFRPLIELALRHRLVTLSTAVTMLVLAVGLLAGGRIAWVFFPSVDSTTVYANVRFVAGTPRAEVDAFLARAEQALVETRDALDPGIVRTWYVSHGASSGGGSASGSGDRFGSLYVELSEPDTRTVTNRQFTRAWRKRIPIPAGVENFTLAAARGGPGGRDLQIRLSGADTTAVKAAALELAEALKSQPGVYAIEDDLPYGREQLIYRVTPAGQALGLSIAELGRQLRAAIDGTLVQRHQEGTDEISVRVRMDAASRTRLGRLEELPIRLPDGRFVPLASVAAWDARRGFEALRHNDGRLAATVYAEVDAAQNNIQQITAWLATATLPALAARHGIEYDLEGSAARQRETLADMLTGMQVGLLMIYIVLAWVFGSYIWPLAVMVAIPFGLVGALFGHWVMGLDLTLLSLFGFFGLSGIVVNNSIILVTFYQRLRNAGMAVRDALTEAACQRLRAVLLTSLTTIAGLSPLLFETSLQAQFLIPMAASIAFGLAFGTLLILLVLPSLLSLYEEGRERRAARRATTT